jgi:uncharacterized protein DUF1553/uncharacterized protein DUF1549/cytochrome c
MRIGWSIVGIALALLAQTTHCRAGDAEFFEKRVRPILVDNCYSCHSAAATKLKAGLRLDSRTGMLVGGDSGPAIVPGKPADSQLIRAIQYDDVELRMPPKGKLPDAAITDLTEWIKSGATWPNEAANQKVASTFDLQKRKAAHWAWQPVRSVAPPTVRDAAQATSPIDRFILAKLEAQNLRPAPPAKPHELLRRIYFDLIGLPPPPEVARAFAADSSEAAYEKIVDRLLASPQFGERWARHWLDLVRYAETRGNEFDYHNPNAWQYRDYVIRALNSDVPYNQFVTEHLAGDLLSNPRHDPERGFNESILATGCWFFGDQVHSPVDLKRDEADHLDTMIDVFSKSFLGLTVSCARCHDHKFDAISTKDYYALLSVFASSGYRQVRFETEKKERDLANRLHHVEIEHQCAIRAEIAAQLRNAFGRSPEPLTIKSPESVPDGVPFILDPGAVAPDRAAFHGFKKVGAILPNGDRLRVNTLQSAVVDPRLFDIRCAGQNDPGDLGKRWRVGRTIASPEITLAGRKIACLMRGKAMIYVAVQAHRMIEGPLHRDLVKLVDAGPEFRWVALDMQRYTGHRAHVEVCADSADFAVAAVIETNEIPGTVKTEIVEQAEIRKAIDRFADDNCDAQSAAIVDALLLREKIEPGPALAEYRQGRERLLADLPKSSQIAPAMFDIGPVDERVFIRGNPHNLGERVPRAFLEALSGGPFPNLGSGRLELARRVTDPAINPLIGRVFVNRVWHHLFGRGIVASTDNFGVLGEAPTHPELLDWLADDFVQHGWSLKRLIRSIVMTNAYRMSSSGEASADAADPQNRLWHRANVRRLEGEAIRDSILAVSGALDPKMFGPPVPIHLTPFMEGRGRPGHSGPLDGAGRRSIYLEVRRNFPDPFLTTFDLPGPGNTVGKRSVSNVPAQALVLLNDPFVHEQAERWAKGEADGSASDRVEHMYWTAFGRGPSEAERKACLDYVSNNDWPALAHALWNVKEFIYLR